MQQFDPAVTKPKAREEVARWIDAILKRNGWTGTDLAKRARIAPSTILRFLNNPDYQFTPSSTTLAAIASASGVALPEGLGHSAQSKSTAEKQARSLPIQNASHGEADQRRFRNRWALSLNREGCLALPEQLRNELPFDAGEKLMGRIEGDTLIVESAAVALRRVQDLVRRYNPEGSPSPVDELIAERREAAKHE